ncbi:MAG: transposase, partial [Acidimicrobiales bacterium]
MSVESIMDAAFTELIALSVTVVAACALIGRSRATHYRRISPPPRKADPIPHAERAKPPSTLTDIERQRVLQVINQPAYADLAICQIWARELDEDRYHGSMSTMYRIARTAGQVRERRALATHPAKKIPELLATGPSEVWSWDITKLRGPAKGVWYHLYVLIDIFSRYTPGWMVRPSEDSVVAGEFIDEAVARNGSRPHTIHADRGTSMTSKTVATLLVDLGISRSHSRPRVSNDNPYSEAQFKTLKYVPDFPHHFDSLADARAFCDGFFTDYNHVHHHSGIGWHTPASVHQGTYADIDEHRQQTLNRAYTEHPERFTRRPRPPQIQNEAWINEPA